MKKSLEAVSIVLKTWNAAQYVKLCLEYLLKNTSSEFELIIVDNGSRQKLVEMLARLADRDPRVKLLVNENNMGPGFANRQGFASATHQLICLLDSDVLVPNGWLEKLTSEMANDPAIKMLAPLKHEESVIYPFGKESKDSREVWFETKRMYKNLSPRQQFLKYSNGYNLEEFNELVRRANMGQLEIIASPPDFLGTSCVLLDRLFVEQVGGVADPDFRAYGSEDIDLCWRIGQAGGLVAKSRAVYIHHFHGASLADNRLDRRNALVLANQILYEKWKGLLLEKALNSAKQNQHKLIDFLEHHFIFHQLAENTAFMHDLRRELERMGIAVFLPDEIIWTSSAI